MNSNVISFTIAVLILSSCHIVAEHRSTFVFKNNSNVNLGIVLDFNPSDGEISTNSQLAFAYQHTEHYVSRSSYNSFDKCIKDSAYLYVAYLDSLNKDKGEGYMFNINDIKEQFLIARMTIRLEDIQNPFHSGLDTIYFPPAHHSTIPIMYYPVESSKD